MDASSHGPSANRPAGPLAAIWNVALALDRNAKRNLAQWCRVLTRASRARNPPLRMDVIFALLLVAACVVPTMFLVDARATAWARQLPQWITNVFEEITNAGLGGWWLVPTCVLVLVFAAITSPALPLLTRGVLATLAARFGFLFLAIGVPGLFDDILKGLIGRARPFVGGHLDPFAYLHFVWETDYASMPSGHSTNVAAAAMAVGAIWPRLRLPMWLYALVIMVSRVIVFAHFTSDVIAGALVGVVGAALMRRFFAARRLVFSPHDLSAYPGPSLARIWTALRRAAGGGAAAPRNRGANS
jgi:membrane-associated phospholipid phosphatase